jgi:hypothetical protein
VVIKWPFDMDFVMPFTMKFCRFMVLFF